MKKPYFKILKDAPEPLRAVVKTVTRFEEIDSMGIAWHGRFASYFEDARMKYFESTGVMEHMTETQIGPILASTTCNFRAPLVFPDRIYIAARIEEMKNDRSL